jgi:hypothetical protein
MSNKMENIGIIIDILTHEDDIFCEKAEVVLEQMMALHKAGSSKEVGDDGAYEVKSFDGEEDIQKHFEEMQSESEAAEADSGYDDTGSEAQVDETEAVSEDSVAEEASEEDEEPKEAQGYDGYYENGDYEPRRGARAAVKRPAPEDDDDDDHYEPGMRRKKMTVSGDENAKPKTVPSVQGPADEAYGDYEAVGTVEHQSSVPSAYPPGIQAQVDALQRAIAYGYDRKQVQSVRDRLTKLSTDAFDKGDITERQLELLLNM